MNHNYLAVFLLLLFSHWNVRAQKDEREICGSLIDSRGKAVEKARIYLEGDGLAPSDIFYFYESDNKGRFCLPAYAKSGESLLMMTSFPIPAESVPLLEIPSNAIVLKQRMNDALQKVTVQENKKINIGSVKVLLRYSIINLEILKSDGSPAYTKQQDWRRLIFQLLDSKGEKWAGMSLSDEKIVRCVDKQRSRIRLAVPDGKWSIQIGTATIENSQGVKKPFFTSPLITVNFDKKKLLSARIIVK